MYIWMESYMVGFQFGCEVRPRLFIYFKNINLTFHLNSNQNFKPFKMTDDRSLESISKFNISTSVT